MDNEKQNASNLIEKKRMKLEIYTQYISHL
jgi:hypothetical protein